MSNTQGLTVKDLIFLGVFSALYVVFYFAGGIPFGINPTLTWYQPAGSALLAGPVYMFITAKVNKRFAISILAILLAFAFFITGMHWTTALGTLVTGLIAEVVASLGAYKKLSLLILSYPIFTIGETGTFVLYFYDTENWVKSMLERGTPASYLEGMASSSNQYTLAIVLISTAVASLVGAWIGAKLLKKQFSRAGVV